MPIGPNSPYTKLDMNHILQRAFVEGDDRLRVDASVTATIGDIVINAEDSDIAIKDRVTDNLLKINNDGSIDANVIINANDDNILVLGSTDGTISGTKRVLKTNSVGNLETVQINNLVPFKFDSIFPTYPSTTVEVYEYRELGLPVATVTVTYVNALKEEILSIIRV